MQNITSLDSLYKRDSKGKVRVWTVQVGYTDEDTAGIRSISGTVDGENIACILLEPSIHRVSCPSPRPPLT